MWANAPPKIVPVEVSKELLDGDGYVLKDAYVGECVGNYTVGIYSCIDVVVTFTGSAAAPIFQLLGPSILLVIFSWLHFWIHGSWSVPRTISSTVPFILFTVLIIFYPQPHLGRTGIGATQVWLIFCAAITFASLVEYFLVICTGAGSTKRAKYAPPQTLEKTPLTEVEIQSESRRGNYQATSNLDIIARIIFPIIFIIFVIIFLIFYLI
uniref:Amino acid/auxin permease-like protein n=2 Tax=Bursaphelenchus xylophilus TaxID=6326 RepID=A0A1I7SVM5_BURXY